jgi:hypothetical protein
MNKTEEILEKIFLPLDSSWKIAGTSLDAFSSEISIELKYDLPYVEVDGERYKIYDFRPLRRWRHLDLWNCPTFITARLPRYKDGSGCYRTVEVPWADSGEQMTDLLKKKS